MTTTVIAYFPSPPQGVWHLWLVPIRAYALFIIIGIVAALLIGDRRWQARGGERGVIYDIALWAVPFGLIGGRLYHLATDWRTYFGEGGAGPAAALRICAGARMVTETWSADRDTARRNLQRELDRVAALVSKVEWLVAHIDDLNLEEAS